MASEPQLVLVGRLCATAQPGILFCTFDSAHGVLTKRGAATVLPIRRSWPSTQTANGCSGERDQPPPMAHRWRHQRTVGAHGGTFTLTTQPSGGDWPATCASM
ncbi:MAG: hypothetical protein U0074_10845 [Kouleothrix sp.]